MQTYRLRSTLVLASAVAAAAAIGGTLDVVLLGGFEPAYGDTFDILNLAARDGAFDAVDLPVLGGGLSWDASQLYTDGVLTVVPEPATLALLGLGISCLEPIRVSPVARPPSGVEGPGTHSRGRLCHRNCVSRIGS